jgi:surface protein
MDNMFFDADSFNQPLNNWDVSNVTTMWALFGFANNFNQPLNNWDVSNVTQMAYMFVWAASFNQPLNNWQLKPGVSIYEFLNSSGMDCNNYSASLAGWAANPNTPSNLIIGVQGRQYGTNVVTQRTFLDVNKNWTFNGDTPSSSICSFILPITLLSFEVSNTGMKNHLNWTTTSEINNHFFDIEYSSDGKEFKSIGAILGSGTTTETKNYSFIHDRPSAGINYYRIKQVDFDGQYSYSDVASVRIDHDSAFQNFTISPNPVVSGFPFSLQGVEVDSDIKLYTLQGQEVQIERVSGGAEFIIDVPTGIYYINDNQHSRFSKIVVIK